MYAWTLVAFYSMEELNGMLYSYFCRMLLISGLVIFVFLIVDYILAQVIYSPMNALLKELNRTAENSCVMMSLKR